MKDFRNRKNLEHDYNEIIGDHPRVPTHDNVDKIMWTLVWVSLGLLIGFFLWR